MKPHTDFEPLAWFRTPKRRVTYCTHDRIWRSRCGRYRVVEARPDLSALPLIYYATVRCLIDGRTVWDRILQAETFQIRKRASVRAIRRRAFQSCERHAAGDWQPRKPR